MRTQTVRLRHTPDVYVDATVDVMTGRPLVVIDSEASLIEDINHTPAEAERYGAALIKAARFCRAKQAWDRGQK